MGGAAHNKKAGINAHSRTMLICNSHMYTQLIKLEDYMHDSCVGIAVAPALGRLAAEACRMSVHLVKRSVREHDG
jgi:hypothetical protein